MFSALVSLILTYACKNYRNQLESLLIIDSAHHVLKIYEEICYGLDIELYYKFISLKFYVKIISKSEFRCSFDIMQLRIEYFRKVLQFYSVEIRTEALVHMLQQFFLSVKKSAKEGTPLDLYKKENHIKPAKINKTVEYSYDRIRTESTQIEPIKLIQNFDFSNLKMQSTLRKTKKFQRKSTLNSSKINKNNSLTQRMVNCEQDTINQCKKNDEKQNRERQRSGSIIFPTRSTNRSELSVEKKKHLVRSNKGFLISPKEEELKSICRESSDEIGNIKPLRMCLQEFIYCTGKRVKYIPMSSILKSPQANIKKRQSQIPTQSTISNFRQLTAERQFC